MRGFNPFEQNLANQSEKVTISVIDKDFQKQTSFQFDLVLTERALEQSLENAKNAIGLPSEDLRVIIWEKKKVFHFNNVKKDKI